jgi:hypothetical protein
MRGLQHLLHDVDQDLVLHPGEATEANVPISAPAPARPGTKAQGQSAATKARRQKRGDRSIVEE